MDEKGVRSTIARYCGGGAVWMMKNVHGLDGGFSAFNGSCTWHFAKMGKMQDEKQLWVAAAGFQEATKYIERSRTQ